MDQRARRRWSGQTSGGVLEAMEQREQERSGLACACLRLAGDILTVERQR